MPERVNLDQARRVAGQLNNLGGKPVSGRPTVRMAAWTIERMAEEIEALRAECAARAKTPKPPAFNHTSFRLFRAPAPNAEA